MRRRVGEEYNPECVLPTIKGGGGSVMIWGCMAAKGVGTAFVCTGRMNSATYVNMLEQVLEPSITKIFAEEERKNVIFQQDNAPCHTARASTAWFLENGIRVLDWPPQSPDLNPIEHLWSILKKRVHNRKSASKRELENVIMQEWNSLPSATCQKLVHSMPRRIAAVLRAKGGPTKY